MSKVALCDACTEQVKKGLYDGPHDKLSVVASKAFRGAMSGGHDEIVYKCANCSALIFHMRDKNDFKPFWYQIDEIPDWK